MESLKKQAAKLLGEQKKYRRWLAVFLCLAIVVAAGTTSALKMNGQALSHKEKVLDCGLEVHEHTEECYKGGVIPAEGATSQGEEEKPVCGFADYVVHVHNDDCYGEDGELVCQLPEIEAHVHEESCFEDQVVLVCGKEEDQVHQHTDACRTLICGKEETQGTQAHQHTASCRELICGKEETEGHQHTDACRSISRGELKCTNTDEGHEHTEECYEQIETIICGQEETEAHVHTEECYGPYICGMEEGSGNEAHIHTEECYSPYICGMEEGNGNEAHVHSESCYQIKKVAVCGKLELHTHVTEEENSCYDEQGNLICGIPELREHVHDENCFKTIVEKEEEKDKVEEAVEGTNNSTISGEVAGTKPGTEKEGPGENGKTSAADGTGESEEDGVKAEGTGESGEGGVKAEDTGESGEGGVKAESTDGKMDGSENTPIAGGTEHSKVYMDGRIKVTARYGETANISEEAELFAEYLETENTDSAEEDVAEGTGQEDEAAAGEELPAENITVRLGFRAAGEEITPEDTVTFTVQCLKEDGSESEESAVLVFQAGDSTDALTTTLVRERTAEIPRNYRKICETASVRVTVEYGSDAKIPEEAELQVRQITEETDAEHYAAREAALQEALGREEAAIDTLLNIGFYVDGTEVEPEAPVTVSIQFLDGEGLAAGEPVTIVHFAHEGTEVLNGSEVDESGVTTFQMDSFSEIVLLGTDVAVSAADESEDYFIVHGYVSDGTGWWPVNEGTQINCRRVDGSGDRYCIKASDLDVIFGAYGYSSESVSAGSRQVGHDGSANSKIWVNAPAIIKDEVCYWPLLNAKNRNVYVYYLGNFTLDTGNSFSANDREKIVNCKVERAADESVYQIKYKLNFPEVDAVLIGKGDDSFGDEAEKVVDGDGAGIVFPYSVEAPGYRLVKQRGEKGEFKYYEFDHWVTAGGISVNGEIGWGVCSGAVPDGTKNTIELTAVWREPTQNSSPLPKVNFYVCLSSKVLETSNSNVGTAAGNFTGSVFQTTTNAVYTRTVSKYCPAVYQKAEIKDNNTRVVSNVLVIEDNEATAEIDAQIRNLAAGGVEVTGYDGQTWNYQLADFPTDEAVFEKIRTEYESASESDRGKWTVRIGEKDIPIEELKPDNFTIRWYVFKHDTSDEWHVDGVLVRKQGSLTVTKTFYGDESAIEAVKNGFHITVTERGKTDPDYKLTLNPKSESEESTGEDLGRGYDYITEKDGEVTYTWVLGVTANKTFLLKENNYVYSDNENKIATLAEYRLSNTGTNNSGAETAAEDWQRYPETGVEVLTESYAADLNYESYQAVNFRNGYLPRNAVSIWKFDNASKEGLSGVTFRLFKKESNTEESNTAIPIYQKDGDYYLYSVDGATETADLQVNGTGHLVLHGVGGVYEGNYTLKEIDYPAGYQAENVTFNIAQDGSVSLAAGSTAKLTEAEPDGNHENGKAYRLDIPNSSDTIDITVRKEWEGVEDSEKQQVKVQLWRGNVPTSHEVTLNADNNWTQTITGLPLNVNGVKADYKLREIKIGETNYDAAADEDGYQFYKVTYSALVETDIDEGKKQGTLAVRNAVEGGNLSFTKQDAAGSALAGATFALYNNPGCSGSPAATAVSGAEGQVTFNGLRSDIYYMKETKAPDGYKLSGQIYKVTFANRQGVIVNWNNAAGNGDTSGESTGENQANGQSEGQEENQGDDGGDGIPQESAPAPISVITNEIGTQPVKIVKEDTKGERLNGARFTLTATNLYVPGSFVPQAEGYTSALVGEEKGVVAGLLELPYGTYTLTETNPPEDYIAANPVTITINANGVTASGREGEFTLSQTAGAGGGAADVWTLTVKNRIGVLNGLSLTKVSNEKEETKLGGAEFILGKIENGIEKYAVISGTAVTAWEDRTSASLIKTAETGDDTGTAALPKLPEGIYFLKEVTAPKGYNLLNNSIEFTIGAGPDGLTLTIEPTVQNGRVDSADNKNIIITNSKGIALPETGGSGTVWYTLGGIAIIAASLMYGLSMRRKNRKGGLR